jgi:hypothetical protein
MLTALTFIGFVVLAVACVSVFGPFLGAVLWLIAFGIVRLLLAVLGKVYDPNRAFTAERAAIPPTRLGATSRSATSPRLLRSRMATLSSRLRPRRRSRL